MEGIFASIGEKLGFRGGGDKIQYLLAGTLVLVIVISLIAAITTFSDRKGAGLDEHHFYDVETGEEFVITADEMKEMAKSRKPGDLPMGRPGTAMNMRMVNPKTGERTGIPMTKCVKCEEWFLPEYLMSEDPRARMSGVSICTHCGTNQIEYIREQRRNKKKNK